MRAFTSLAIFIVSLSVFSGCQFLKTAPEEQREPAAYDYMSTVVSDFELSPDAPLPKAEFPLRKFRDFEISEVTEEQAQQIFNSLAKSNLPFTHSGDCCHDRAHKMAFWMEQSGLISVKVFVFGHLIFRNARGMTIQWEFHVAPALMGPSGELLVFDPSTALKPLELSAWKSLFTRPGDDSKVRIMTRYYYSPPQFSDEVISWDKETTEIVDLSLMGCKSVELRRIQKEEEEKAKK